MLHEKCKYSTEVLLPTKANMSTELFLIVLKEEQKKRHVLLHQCSLSSTTEKDLFGNSENLCSSIFLLEEGHPL